MRLYAGEYRNVENCILENTNQYILIQSKGTSDERESLFLYI